eukprot:1146520-Pelagomonas_calceolata.AAC.2
MAVYVDAGYNGPLKQQVPPLCAQANVQQGHRRVHDAHHPGQHGRHVHSECVHRHPSCLFQCLPSWAAWPSCSQAQQSCKGRAHPGTDFLLSDGFPSTSPATRCAGKECVA